MKMEIGPFETANAAVDFVRRARLGYRLNKGAVVGATITSFNGDRRVGSILSLRRGLIVRLDATKMDRASYLMVYDAL